jgi:hypothetical protein
MANLIHNDETNVVSEFKVSREIQNRALLALAYKIIDNLHYATLFGGIVREIIAPAYISGDYPFRLAFKTNYELSDIDIIFELNDKDEKERLISIKLEIDNLRSRLRSWDWYIDSIKDLSIYQTKGYRVFLINQIIGIKTHLDIIDDPKDMHDVNVNSLRFNKNKGLFLSSCGYGKKIEDNFFRTKHFDSIMHDIENKICRMVCGFDYFDENQKERIVILRLRRFIKMLRNGWNITNKNSLIEIEHENKDSICMICHNQPRKLFINLKCSRCYLCMNCFENLLTKNFNFESKAFKCPTCRQEIIPWE